MVEYSCPICKDAGYVHQIENGKVRYDLVITCKCMVETLRRQTQERYIRFCQLPVGTEHMTFENFKTGGNASLIQALNYAKELADGTGEVRWLTLIGEVDRGKSHLAIAVCRSWLERGMAARYAFVPLLLKELRDGFELEGEESYRIKMNFLCNVGLLVMDDLGVERSTPWGLEQLQTIVHSRGISGLSLVVTANKEIDRICGNKNEDERLASNRIASRLQREQWCRVVEIDAGEHRLKGGNASAKNFD